MIKPDDDWDEDDDWTDDSVDVTLAACPKCGASVYDDIERCAYCGEWIGTTEYAGSARKRLFVAIMAVVLLSSPLWYWLLR